MAKPDSPSPELTAQLTNIFGTFFSQHAVADWPNVHQHVRITEAEATAGVTRNIAITRQNECAHCEGHGSPSDEAPIECNRCKGSGKRTKKQGDVMIATACTACDGLGKFIIDPCGICEGVGTLAEVSPQLTVTVPPGTQNQTTLRLVGAGARRIAASPGDVLVQVSVGDVPLLDPALDAHFAQLSEQLRPQHGRNASNLPQAVVRGSRLPSRSLLPSKQNVMIYAVAIAVVVAFVKFMQLFGM